jgi:hypothetical protein
MPDRSDSQGFSLSVQELWFKKEEEVDKIHVMHIVSMQVLRYVLVI